MREGACSSLVLARDVSKSGHSEPAGALLSSLRDYPSRPELFTDRRGNLGAVIWVWQWVRFAKTRETLIQSRYVF
jgi:hypothetical protein